MRGGGAHGNVDVRILGPVEVWQGEARLAVTSGKQRLLLAALALRTNQVVGVDVLIDDLWGAAPPAGAEKTLRAHVSHLRSVLACRREPAGGAPVLLARRPGYALEIRDELLDAARFLAMAKEGRAALGGGDPRRAAALLADALALWRGELAAGCNLSPDLLARGVVFDEERVAAFEDRIDADLALGRHAQVVGEVDALVTAHPLRERLRELQMLALYRSGRQAEALRAYQQARQTLVEQLGIEPGPGLRDLESAILRQDPALDLASSGGRAVLPPTVPSSDHRPKSAGFVGRAAELAALHAGLGEAVAGRGQVFLIVGEGGAGKTRLLDEVALGAEASGALVLRGRCDEASGAPPFWPWVEVLRALVHQRTDDEILADTGSYGPDLVTLVPELATRIDAREPPPPLPPDAARFRLFDAVTAVIRRAARTAPVAVILDDLQWADASSFQLLDFFARRVNDTPVLVAAAWRGDELEESTGLGRAAARLFRAAATTTLALDGLSAGDVAQLLEAVTAGPVPGDVAKAVRTRTGGNPLFVLELGRAARAGGQPLVTASSSVPPTLRAAVSRRVDRVGEHGRAALELAAVAGRSFSLAELQRAGVLDRSDLLAGIDELVMAGAIHAVAESAVVFEFHHDLLRQAIYESMPRRQRGELHAALARGLQAIDLTGARVEEIAEHFGRAAAAGGDYADTAIEYAYAVGTRAERAHAHDRAAAAYERALAVVDFGTRLDDRGELLARLGEARWHIGDTAGSREAHLAAIDVAAATRATEVMARAALGLGSGGVANGVVDDELVGVLTKAIEGLAESHAALRSRLQARLAMELYFSPGDRRSISLAEAAVAIARGADDAVALGEALLALHFCLRRPGQRGARQAVAGEALAIAEAAGVPELVLRARQSRIGDLVEAGDLAGLVEEIEAYAGLAEEARQPAYRALVLAWRALVAQIRGEFDEAEALAGAALELGSVLHPQVFLQIYGAQLGTLRWEQGRASEVAPVVRDFVDTYPGAPAWRAALALFAVDSGDVDEARTTFEALAAEGFARIPEDVNWMAAMAILALVCQALADTARAAELYERLEPHRDEFVLVGGVAASACYGSVAFFLGVLADTMGDRTTAKRHYETAVAANERLGAVRWRARAKAALNGRF